MEPIKPALLSIQQFALFIAESSPLLTLGNRLPGLVWIKRYRIGDFQPII